MAQRVLWLAGCDISSGGEFFYGFNMPLDLEFHPCHADIAMQVCLIRVRKGRLATDN